MLTASRIARFAVVPLSLLFAAPSPARVWTVLPDGSGDAPTIQAAVDSANDGDTVALASGSFSGPGNREVLVDHAGLTIRSLAGSPDSCAIDCGEAGRAFRVTAGSDTLVIEGIAFRGGRAEMGGAIRLDGAAVPRITDCLFEGNTGEGLGGALFLGSPGTLFVEDSRFENNRALCGDGGCGGGGAIACRPGAGNCAVLLTRCVMENNESDGPGGGIYLVNADLTMDSCEVLSNRSGLCDSLCWPAGAGLHARRTDPASPEMTVTLAGCRFHRNEGMLCDPPGAGDGGGVLIKGLDENHTVDLHATDCLFSENFSIQGAGLYIGRFCLGLVERCRFHFNLALKSAGATYKGGFPEGCLGEVARYEYCEFLGNGAGFDASGDPSGWPGRGGAFMTRLRPRGEFVNCSFSGNRVAGADRRGGALFHWREEGCFADSCQRCLLLNCVFFGDDPGDVQVRADSCGFSAVAGCAWAPGEFSCEGVLPTDTVLLAESPFLSADSLRLAEGSPCIDRGIDLGAARDIEGAFVPQGAGPEIGAYEHPDSLFTGAGGAAGEAPPLRDGRLAVRPNPFNPRTTIAFDLEARGPVRLTVHAISGRLVAVLADGVFPAGTNEIVWKGRDRSGRPLPSGAYLIRFRTPGGEGVRKTLLLR